METADVRLVWGWTGNGLQPIRFEDVVTGSGYDFASGPLWLVELAPTLTTRELLAPADLFPTFVQASATSWSITWSSADGVSVTFTVDLVDRAARWGFSAATNTSGKRIRSVYGPLLRIESVKATDEDVFTNREERLVSMFWTGNLINDPVRTLFESSPVVPDDPNFVPGFEDANLPGWLGLYMDGPGTYVAEVGGFYDRTTEHYLGTHSTDLDGASKRWIYASDGASILIGWQHFIPGGLGNTFTLGYEIRTKLGTSAAGLQWQEIAGDYREYLEALAPPPRWLVEPGHGSKRCRDAAFVVTANSIPPVVSAAATTLASDAAVGTRSLTVASAASVAVGDWAWVEGGGRHHLARIIAVAGSVIEVDAPTRSVFESGSVVRFTGDPYSVNSTQTLDDVRELFINACEYVGVPTSRAILIDYFAFPRFEGVGGPPDMGGSRGFPSGVLSHTEAMRAMGAGHVVYTIATSIGEDSVAETRYSLASEFPALRDDGTVRETSHGVSLGGRETYVDNAAPAVGGDLIRSLGMFVSLYGFSGLYLDAHVGAPADRYRSYYVGLDDADQGDSVRSRNGWLDQIDRLRDEINGDQGGALLLSGNSALSSGGALLSGGVERWSISSDDAEIGPLVETQLEAAPGVRVSSGPCALTGIAPVGCHAGQAVESSGSVRAHGLNDGGRSQVHGLSTGYPIRFEPNAILTSENPVGHALDRFDMLPHKAEFPLVFNSIPLPPIWAHIFGGRIPTYNLTDHIPNDRIRSGSSADMEPGVLAERSAVSYLEWLAGGITSVLLFNEADSMLVAKMNPSGGLQTYEGRLCELYREFVQWDLVDKVRRYRREGGRHVWSEYGKGRLLEAWEAADSTLLEAGASTAVDAFRSPEGLLIAVATLPYLHDSSTAVSVIVDVDDVAELAVPGAAVYELDKNGGEAEVVGAISGGFLTLSLTVDARAVRLFEVR